MSPRVILLLALVPMVTAAACLQKLDETASNGSPVKPPTTTTGPDKPLSTVILPGPRPFDFIDESGMIKSSDNPCDVTRAQALRILTTDCAGCHGGRTPGERAGNPPF